MWVFSIFETIFFMLLGLPANTTKTTTFIDKLLYLLLVLNNLHENKIVFFLLLVEHTMSQVRGIIVSTWVLF